MKKLFFKHDIGARNDLKIQQLIMQFGAEGLGIYWCLIELLYENNGFLIQTNYKCIAFVLHTSEELVKGVLESSLFEYDEDKKAYYSQRVLDEITEVNELSEKRKASVNKRWQGADNQIV